MSTRTLESVALVCFGRGGHSEDMRSSNGMQGTLSGYEKHPESWTPSPGRDYSDCLVIDKHPALDKADAEGHVVALVIGMPLCNVDLEDDQVQECPEPSPVLASALTQDKCNAFGTLLLAHKAAKRKSTAPGPLDQVSRATYCRLWKEAGARIGRLIVGRETFSIDWLATHCAHCGEIWPCSVALSPKQYRPEISAPHRPQTPA